MRKEMIIKFVIGISLLITLIVSVTNDNWHENVTEKEKREMIHTVKNYYDALEKQNFEEAFSYLNWNVEEKQLVNEFKQRKIALKELKRHLDYKISFDSIVSNQVSFDRERNKYVVWTVANISYRDIDESHMNETFIFEKISDKWKIVKIESSDRYIPFRSNKYLYKNVKPALIPKL